MLLDWMASIHFPKRKISDFPSKKNSSWSPGTRCRRPRAPSASPPSSATGRWRTERRDPSLDDRMASITQFVQDLAKPQIKLTLLQVQATSCGMTPIFLKTGTYCRMAKRIWTPDLLIMRCVIGSSAKIKWLPKSYILDAKVPGQKLSGWEEV